MPFKKKWRILVSVILFMAVIVHGSMYIINPDEQIILIRLGRVEKGPIKEPGYHFKLFVLDQVIRYPSNEIMINIEFPGCPPQIQAFHGTISFIIVNPINFSQTIRSVEYLQQRVSYLLNERYCDEIRKAVNDTHRSSVSGYVETELKKYGVSMNSSAYFEDFVFEDRAKTT